jgi:hypothetical protein
VDDPRALEAIYALRYAVYVEEMGRPQSYADHQRRRLAEPVDRDAIHLAAYRDPASGGREGGNGLAKPSDLLGALRIHVVGRADVSFLSSIHPDLLRSDGVRRGAVTRLVTRPEARGGGRQQAAGLALAIAAYRIGLREALDVVHIDCKADLAPFFEWLGFDVERAFHHADYGDIAVMRLRLHDRARLARSSSPFTAVLDAWSESDADAPESVESLPALASATV